MTAENADAQAPMDRVKALFRPRLVRYGLGGLAAFLILFGLIGYFWLPGFAKARLEALLSEEFQRPVRVEGIDISPYALSATIRGFSIGKEPDSALVSFESLHVNLSSLSMARAMPVVSEIRLVKPRFTVVRLADGRYNFSDLLDKWTAPKPGPKEPEGPPPQFSLSDITIEGGAVVFDDQKEQTRHEVTDIALGIPFITNAPGSVESTVEPRFSCKVDGAPLALKASAKPFAPGQDAAMDLSIDDFDLIRLAAYLPPDLPARLESARLSTRLTVTFARPKGQDAKVRVAGGLSLRDVSLASARKGGAVVRLGGATLTIEEASLAGAARCALALADFSLRRGGAEPLLGFAGLEVKGVAVDTAKRQADVAEVALKNPSASLRRLVGGALNVQELAGDFAAPPAKPAKAQPPAPKPAPKDDKGKETVKPPAPWAWTIGKAAISGGKVVFTDETIGKKGRSLTASGLNLALERLASAPGTTSKLDFSTRINEQGAMAAKGAFSLAPLAADLDLDLARVDLVAVQGWATQDLNAVLTRGEISLRGALKLAGEDAAFKGELALIDFSVLDKLNATDMLRWRSLRLTGLDAGSAPLRFAVSDIALSSFHARLLLSPEGKLNVQNLVHQDEAVAEGTTPPAAQAKPAPQPPAQVAEKPAEAAKPAPAPQIKIGRISLSGGDIVFTDRFIRPNYTANLTDLSGHIGAVRPGTRTDLLIRGKVDRTGPLEISGAMDPLGTPLGLDIKAKATGIEMSSFSPYSGRYVGYAIEKGKLSVDVRYQVDQGKLKAENKVFLDQLTFGQKVESKDAMSIPVNLVVALLSNSRGEIDINLPIEGSLNDPQFSLGGVIVKVILNLLVKAATSPFTLLASLFGGGEELSYVAFEPGRAAIGPDQAKHLETLAKALRDRPGLKLDLAGSVDPDVEMEGLKRADLEHRVKAQKATELARRGKASGGVDEVAVTPEEYPRYLERVYKAADFKKPRNLIGLAKGLPPEEMEALLLANTTAGKEGMERLAKDRGIAVQAWLVDKGGIDQARVFLLAPKVGGETPKGAKPGGRVDFSLR